MLTVHGDNIGPNSFGNLEVLVADVCCELVHYDPSVKWDSRLYLNLFSTWCFQRKLAFYYLISFEITHLYIKVVNPARRERPQGAFDSRGGVRWIWSCKLMESPQVFARNDAVAFLWFVVAPRQRIPLPPRVRSKSSFNGRSWWMFSWKANSKNSTEMPRF